MSTRQPAQAGRFYPRDARACRRELGALFGASGGVQPAIGAVTPHAGWVYSGPTSALAIRSVMASEPETVVVFGAVHVRCRQLAVLCGHEIWSTPLGDIGVDTELASRFAALREVDTTPNTHATEHSIEVVIPLIQHCNPTVRIVPIMVCPSDSAASIGAVIASEVADCGRHVAYLASTDLTHYGPAFAFEPAGHGEKGIRWAKNVNDRRFVELVVNCSAEAVVAEAATHRNACGAGAVAALLGAMAATGHARHTELAHTCSAEPAVAMGERPVNSVGYFAGSFAI